MDELVIIQAIGNKKEAFHTQFDERPDEEGGWDMLLSEHLPQVSVWRMSVTKRKVPMGD